MSDKEYLTPEELEIKARAKDAAVNCGGMGICALAAEDIPALLSTLRAERAKMAELEKAADRMGFSYYMLMKAVGHPIIKECSCVHCKPYHQLLTILQPDPHDPGPDGP